MVQGLVDIDSAGRGCIDIHISHRSPAVLASPLSVINETLANLQTLSELLLDEVDERVVTSHQLTTERRVCKEALQTIRVLIPKLQAVRCTNVAAALDHPRTCANCDD